jgi:hypothetical protein
VSSRTNRKRHPHLGRTANRHLVISTEAQNATSSSRPNRSAVERSLPSLPSTHRASFVAHATAPQYIQH